MVFKENDTGLDPAKLLIIESFPVQYRAPVYRAIAELSKTGGVWPTVYYSKIDTVGTGRYDSGFGRRISWDEPLLGGYDYYVGPDRWKGFGTIISLIIRKRVGAVLLSNLGTEASWCAYLISLLVGTQVWLRTETNDHAFRRSPGRERLRFALYRIAYSAVGHFFAIGEANRLHYLRCGVSANKITYARYCVTDRWTGINDPKRLLVRAQVRKELGIDDHRQVLLFSGKLQYKKNPECIIEALMLMSEEAMRRFAIVYMGSGECNDELRRLAYNVPHVPVIFIGFKNQLELEKYYLCGDVLILPSRQMGETWGLVVNEALLAGLRVVVSRHVGCVGDFGHFPSVRVFDGTPEGLAIVLSDLPDRSAVEQNRKLLEDYSVSRAAEAIVRRGQWERIVHRTIV